MRRLRALGTSSLIVVALLAVASGPMAAPAVARHFAGFGACPGLSGLPSFSGFGGMPASSGCPGFGAMSAFGGCPVISCPVVCPVACPGLGAFPAFAATPGFGAFPGFAPTGAPTAAAVPTQRVRLTIGDNFFLPAEVSVPVGTQVAWVNTGSNTHSITIPGVRDSGPINPGGRWAAIFAVAGTFDYFDPAFPEMRGRLIVTAQ